MKKVSILRAASLIALLSAPSFALAQGPAGAVERAGLRGLNEGQLVEYELEQDRRTGKASAGNLRVIGGGDGGGGRGPRGPR